ncbi:amidohydrolase [Trichoderma arundinaceum]|uniref:Amidohydrolase n=1 Tax=Trichoderma arundinaceum TaxID=490622 RepID=A0A395P0G1_TRIAR|nr:amidohydrolase [Trichoderma arundinaceum]
MTQRRIPVMSEKKNAESAPKSGVSDMGSEQDLIKPWKLPPQRTYIFKNANIVDTVNGQIIPNRVVKLSEGLIQTIDDGQSAQLVSNGTVVVDLAGKYLCPGLIDCHAHLSSVAGEEGLTASLVHPDLAVSHFRQPYLTAQVLYRGFTSLRDTGGATLALKEALADDVFPGPRLFIANKAISQTGGHGDARSAHEGCCGTTSSLSAIVDGVPAAIHATREQIRQGADFIKIMTSGGVASPTDKLDQIQFTAAEIRAITEVADTYNTYVTAHAYTPRSIRHAVDNGVRGIEHGNLIDKETAEYMAKHNVWFTPTLVTYHAMGSDKYAGFLPPVNRQKNREVLEQGLQSLRLADEAGVTICHGSDLLGPLWVEQSKEFGIRAQALSAKKILQGATINAARMLKQENFLGQIKDGFAADVLVLNGNPLEDITILDEPEKSILAVLKNGRVYKSRWTKLPEDVSRAQTLIE